MAHVTIYTSQHCPFCFAAKQLLSSLGAELEEIPLDRDDELRQRLSRENGGWRTVPMIFIGQRFVGGFDDVQKLHGSGELEPLLAG